MPKIALALKLNHSCKNFEKIVLGFVGGEKLGSNVFKVSKLAENVWYWYL